METNLSRRGFLTGAAAAGALAAMGLAGCAPTPAAEGGTKTADTGAAAATSWRARCASTGWGYPAPSRCGR